MTIFSENVYEYFSFLGWNLNFLTCLVSENSPASLVYNPKKVILQIQTATEYNLGLGEVDVSQQCHFLEVFAGLGRQGGTWMVFGNCLWIEIVF